MTARLESGPRAGEAIQIQLAAGGLDPDVDPGDRIRVTEAPEPPPGAEAVTGTGWSLYDFERGRPMLILADLGVSQAAGLEVVAKEIVATLVGSIGLSAAVPVTTALAAFLAVREDAELLGHDARTHVH